MTWPHKRYLDDVPDRTNCDKVTLSTNPTRCWTRHDAVLAVVALDLGAISTDEEPPTEACCRPVSRCGGWSR